LNVNLSGDFSMEMLKEYAEVLEERIEDIPQITKVDIRGIQEREVKIDVNLYRMESMEVTFNDIENAITSENMTISGGDVVVDGVRRNVRLIGEFKDWREIANVIVKNEKFNIVRLRDVAEVSFEGKERESFSREYGAPVVMLDVMKRGGENLIEASEAVDEIIAQAQKYDFPEGLEITTTNDLTGKTKTQVSELENSIIFGTILVVLVLLFFLGLRSAVFVGIAIPLSMFIAFFILNAMGVTLNMMVLFSLVLALGMLVDNGIVIVENIYRLMDEGYRPIQAAKYGAGEVAWPIIASTATTLAAFVPLALWPGIIGEFMKFLPITLMIVLGSSLFVALVINPVLIALMARMKPRGVKILAAIILIAGLMMALFGVPQAGNILMFMGVFILINPSIISPVTNRFQISFLPRLENLYKKFITFALHQKRPIAFFFGVLGMFILSVFLVKAFPPKVVFFPSNEPAYLNVFIEKPIGTDINETDRDSRIIEQKVLEYFKQVPGYYYKTLENGERDTVEVPDTNLMSIVKSIIAQVGNGTSDPSEGPSMANTPEKARIQISFVEFSDRKIKNVQGIISTSDIMNTVRELLSGNPGVRLVVDKDAAGPPMGKAINIDVSGDDFKKLVDESERMLSFIKSKNIEGIENLKINIQTGKPELTIRIDEQKARRLNLSTAQIGMTIRTALFGKEISQFKQGEEEYDITLRLNEYTRNNIDNLMNQRITFRDMLNGQIRQVPISAVASVKKSSTISAVKRNDLKRTISLQSNVLEADGFNPNEVVAEINEVLKSEYTVADGIDYEFTGQQQEQAKEMKFLGKALAIAIFLILIIIVAQFNSISSPVVILFAVVMSFTGVFTGLISAGMEFVIIMMMIGIISLAGVVVNNAIVLMDYTNLLITRKELELEVSGKGKDRLTVPYVKEAIIEAGRTRLRPVLLTAITTVLGLLPMAIGLNIDFLGFFATGDPSISLGGDNVIFWGPMAWTIIFGLTFATFLTLVIVPVCFYLALRLKYLVLGVPRY
ncbi:MAG: copper transporter, partial [Flavobacteriales bacterium]|nr:copper transporter [Flavobacteriales bacterium]